MASVERNTVGQRAACHSSRSLSTIAWNWDTVGKSDPPVNSFSLRLLTQRPQVRSGSLPNATAPKGTRKTVKPLPSMSLGASKPATDGENKGVRKQKVSGTEYANCSAKRFLTPLVSSALTLLTCLLAGCGSDSSESHSGTNGQRPPDVSEEEWNKVKTQFQRGTGSSNKDAETAADAIFKFERARKARGEK